MERRRKGKVIVIIALLLIIMGISVAFAVMSTTLNINGTGVVSPASLKIQFENLSSTTTGDAEIVTTPIIDEAKTTIGNYSVKLTKPGDSVTFTFDVANRGEIDTILTALTKNTPATLTYTGSGATAVADQDIVKANIIYTLTYTVDGSVVAIGTGSELAAGTIPSAGDVVNMTLKLEYPNTVDILPEDDVQVGGLAITLVYSQNP